jgi:hypothetical protein
MILARFYLRVKVHRNRRLLVSDLLMGAAWCAAFATASFDIVFYKRGALDPELDYTLRNFDTPIENYEYVAKVGIRRFFKLRKVVPPTTQSVVPLRLVVYGIMFRYARFFLPLYSDYSSGGSSSSSYVLDANCTRWSGPVSYPSTRLYTFANCLS